MYISLSSTYGGYACAVKHSILNYTKGNNETQFFDWLVTSMKSVNEILEGKPILFEINPNFLNTKYINFKNFDILTSHHDIHDFSDNSINEITEKYTRRYKRLINVINTQQNIYFVRYCKDSNNIEEHEIIRFYKNILNINPNLEFKFILMSDCDDLIIPDILLKDNFIYINLNNYIDDDILNEENGYVKIIKKYKCVYNTVK